MNAFVIYYKGEKEPLDGLINLGKVTEGIEILEKYPENIEITIDMI